MQPLRLCAFLACIAVLRCYDLPRNLAEYYCVMNGNFSDREQVEKDGASRSAIDIILQPVFAPGLSSVPVVYLEESTAGVLLRANIAIVTQEDDDIFYMLRNNFPGNSDIIPGTFDVNRIKSLTKDDLQAPKDCRNVVERVQPFVFSSDLQNCKQANENGPRRTYVSTETCNEHTLTVPSGAPEKSTLVPYKFKIQGSKYQLENAPDNYVCNC